MRKQADRQVDIDDDPNQEKDDELFKNKGFGVWFEGLRPRPRDDTL